MVRIRLLLENPWHNSTFEGSGFVRLFLPTDAENEDFYSREWVQLQDKIKQEPEQFRQWKASREKELLHAYNRKVIPDLWYRYLTMMHEQECHIYHAYSVMDPQKRDEKLEELKEFRIKGDKFLHFPFLFSKMHKMKMHPRAGH
ncbi:hypothetical protein Tco_0889770 [Tanacetum coccineum]